MKTDAFFTIDVDSEIRSLCAAQLRGTWQMPAELVRSAIRFGARVVDVDKNLRGFTVSWRGGPVGIAILKSLEAALDDSVETERRQQAIADLERSGAEALLWAGGAAGAHLNIRSAVDGGHVRLTRRAGRRPSLNSIPKTSPADEVVVRWSCSKIDRRRAAVWLRTACRFSDAEIRVDGRPVARGFSDGMYRTRLEEPVRCTIGLTRHGEEPVLWLLREGIVAGRAVVPGYPPFEAAVELGGVVTGAAGSSELRSAARPYVRHLCERAVDMMIEVAGRPGRISRDKGQRLLSLILQSAKRNFRVEEIRSLPLLPTLSRVNELLPLSRLEAMAGRRAGRLFAVEPGATGSVVPADAASTIVASSEIRSLLTELTGVRFQPPPRRTLSLKRRASTAVRSAVSRTLERVRGIFGSSTVPLDRLSPGEVRLVAMLRAALSPKKVEIGNGKRLRRTASAYVLPRRDPAVVAAVLSVEEDPAWLYPLVLALKLDAPSFGSLRKDWAACVEGKPAGARIDPGEAADERLD